MPSRWRAALARGCVTARLELGLESAGYRAAAPPAAAGDTRFCASVFAMATSFGNQDGTQGSGTRKSPRERSPKLRSNADEGYGAGQGAGSGSGKSLLSPVVLDNSFASSTSVGEEGQRQPHLGDGESYDEGGDDDDDFAIGLGCGGGGSAGGGDDDEGDDDRGAFIFIF